MTGKSRAKNCKACGVPMLPRPRTPRQQPPKGYEWHYGHGYCVPCSNVWRTIGRPDDPQQVRDAAEARRLQSGEYGRCVECGKKGSKLFARGMCRRCWNSWRQAQALGLTHRDTTVRIDRDRLPWDDKDAEDRARYLVSMAIGDLRGQLIRFDRIRHIDATDGKPASILLSLSLRLPKQASEALLAAAITTRLETFPVQPSGKETAA